MRLPPRLTAINTPYWTGGLAGQLLITRCLSCGYWNHPPSALCRRCLSAEVDPVPTSGDATVVTYTVNHQRWSPDATPDPYVIAIVELPEQAGLRQITNIVNCAVDDVHIGMPVRVTFRRFADVALPLFEPV